MKTATSVIMAFYSDLLESMGIFLWTCQDLGFMLLKRKGALTVKLERMRLTYKDLQASCLILDLSSKEYKHPTFCFVLLQYSVSLPILKEGWLHFHQLFKLSVWSLGTQFKACKYWISMANWYFENLYWDTT